MTEQEAYKFATTFYTSVLDNLHVAICNEAISRKLDLSVDQLELIRETAQGAVKHVRAQTSA